MPSSRSVELPLTLWTVFACCSWGAASACGPAAKSPTSQPHKPGSSPNVVRSSPSASTPTVAKASPASATKGSPPTFQSLGEAEASCEAIRKISRDTLARAHQTERADPTNASVPSSGNEVLFASSADLVAAKDVSNDRFPCLISKTGVWGVALTKVGRADCNLAASDGSLSFPVEELTLQHQVPHGPLQTARVLSSPRAGFGSFPSGWMRVADLDGDGVEELLLRFQNRFPSYARVAYRSTALGLAELDIPALIAERTKIPGLNDHRWFVDDVVDETGDGLADVQLRRVWSDPLHCGEVEFYAPNDSFPFLFVARPDGTFTLDDPSTRERLLRECPPKKRVIDSPNAVLCERLWGRDASELERTIRQRFAPLVCQKTSAGVTTANGGHSYFDALLEAARWVPPLTLY